MSGRGATALAGVLFVLAACGDGTRQREATPGAGEPLEIEDVSPPVDAGLSTDSDVKGARIEDVAGVSGVFPGDYPRDLPMHEPASIVDFGAAPEGWSYVDLDSPSSRALVAADLERRLMGAGWAVEDLAADGLRASRAGVEVRMSLTGSSAGTRIRVEYR
jgi:hypothetical protein